MERTGVLATKAEMKVLKDMLAAPVMYLSGGTPMGGDPVKECHRLALAHGLPEIPGYYGIDNKGEFVRV